MEEVVSFVAQGHSLLVLSSNSCQVYDRGTGCHLATVLLPTSTNGLAPRKVGAWSFSLSFGFSGIMTEYGIWTMIPPDLYSYGALLSERFDLRSSRSSSSGGSSSSSSSSSSSGGGGSSSSSCCARRPRRKLGWTSQGCPADASCCGTNLASREPSRVGGNTATESPIFRVRPLRKCPPANARRPCRALQWRRRTPALKAVLSYAGPADGEAPSGNTPIGRAPPSAQCSAKSQLLVDDIAASSR